LIGVIISGDHKVELIGKDSPGVGLYETHADKIYKISKKNTKQGNRFGMATRFNSVIHGKPNPKLPSFNADTLRGLYQDTSQETIVKIPTD
jgi:hypothetical protein